MGYGTGGYGLGRYGIDAQKGAIAVAPVYRIKYLIAPAAMRERFHVSSITSPKYILGSVLVEQIGVLTPVNNTI